MMKWKLFGLSILCATILWIWIITPQNILWKDSITSAEALTINTSSALVSTPTSTPSSQSTHGSGSGSDSNVFAPWIAATASIIVALISGMFIMYQVRRNSELQGELERQRIESQRELERERIRSELERISYQDRLTAARNAQEREIQRKAMEASASVTLMRNARTKTERVQAYREVLHADPRIAQLQILDMNQPLEVTNIFVRVLLHQETRLKYELEPTLIEAELQRDPNTLLLAGRKYLESRASTALDPDEALRKHPRCVIVGDPGAGKSTLLKYLTLKSVDKAFSGLPEFPILIELNDFASSGSHDLIDFVTTRWNDRYGFLKVEAQAYIEENLAKGNALLLLDALDETVIGETVEEAEASYRRVSEAITQIATRYHKSYIVVTARKAGYRQRPRLDGFTELEVLDFRQEDIQRFVSNWFACQPNPRRQSNAEDLNARLERNPRIQALAANPLLLALIVIVYEVQLDLPDRRAELYRQCVDILLFKWDTSRDIRRRREFKPENKRQLLGEIAWHFHNLGRRYFPENELLRIIADFLPTVGLSSEQNRQILAEIAAENGLLKEQAQGWHGFLHLTLQEYFVAQYVTDYNELETLLSHQGDPWWEEVLLLYTGYTPDASPLLQKLRTRGKKSFLWKDIFLTDLIQAARCLASRPRLRQTALRKQVISDLFKELVNIPYPYTRNHIAEALCEIGGKEVNTQLLRLLSNEQVNPDVRMSIASILSKLGERSIVPDLLRLLSDEQLDSHVRGNIANALSELGERSIVPDLLRLLSDKQDDPNVTEDIAGALGELGERSIVPDLLRLLSDKQMAPRVRGNIAIALDKLGETTVLPDLFRLLSDKQAGDIILGRAYNTIDKLINDVSELRALANFLKRKSFPSQIYAILWSVSLKMKVRIFIIDLKVFKLIKLVKY